MFPAAKFLVQTGRKCLYQPIQKNISQKRFGNIPYIVKNFRNDYKCDYAVNIDILIYRWLINTFDEFHEYNLFKIYNILSGAGSVGKINWILIFPYLHKKETSKPEQRLGGHEGLDHDKLQHVEVEGDQGYDLTSLLGRNQLDT